MELRLKRSRASASAPQQPVFEEDAAYESGHSDAETPEPEYSDEEDSRRGRTAISWTGALEARFLKALHQAGGVWEAKPKAILQRMGAYSTQLTTIQVKSHLQKHRIKVAAQMQQQGLPVPTPSSGSGGATPAVAAAAQHTAAAKHLPRPAPLKVRRPKAPPAGSLVTAEPLQQPAPPRRTSSHQQQQQQDPHAHSLQAQQQAQQAQQQQPHLPPHLELEQPQEDEEQYLQSQQHRLQYQKLLQLQQHQRRYEQLDLGQPMGHHGAAPHGVALHARHAHSQLAHSSSHSHLQQHHPGYGSMHSGGMHTAASAPQLHAAAAGLSHESSPGGSAAAAAAAAGSSAGSDWERLLHLDPAAASPRMMLPTTTRHASLSHLQGHSHGQQLKQGQQQQQQQQLQHYDVDIVASVGAAPALASHPSAPAALWATAGAGLDDWPDLSLGPEAGGPVVVVPVGHGHAVHAVHAAHAVHRHHHDDLAPDAAAMLAPPPQHAQHAQHAAPLHHTSDSDSDHYADLGDLLDMPDLLGGGDDAFLGLVDVAPAVRAAMPAGAAPGGLPPHGALPPTNWALDTSPFF